MPIYLYRCGKCERAQEQLQLSFRSDAPLCPICFERVVVDGVTVTRRVQMERAPTSAAVQFSGSGWAKDGYSKGGK